MTVTRADLLITGMAAVAVVGLFPMHWGKQLQGDTARILVPGQAEQIVALNKEQRYVIAGPLGENVIEVRDGKIRFARSPCNGKQCIHSGWLSQAGDFAACLPNRVSLVIASKEQHYDTINF